MYFFISECINNLFKFAPVFRYYEMHTIKVNIHKKNQY